jgi:hypothetical protein
MAAERDYVFSILNISIEKGDFTNWSTLHVRHANTDGT